MQGDPYQNVLTSGRDFFLTRTATYKMLLQRTQESSVNIALNFQTSVSPSSYLYLDDVSLTAVNAENKNAWNLVLNTESQTKTISLPNGYQYLDVYGNLVSNRVNLDGYGSILLLDQGFNSSLVEEEVAPFVSSGKKAWLKQFSNVQF